MTGHGGTEILFYRITRRIPCLRKALLKFSINPVLNPITRKYVNICQMNAVQTFDAFYLNDDAFINDKIRTMLRDQSAFVVKRHADLTLEMAMQPR